MAVHDRLRQPGGAGGVEHPQGVIEGHLLEVELGALAARQEIRPLKACRRAGPACAVGGVRAGPAPAVRGARAGRLPVQIGREHDVLHRRQLGEDALESLAAVEVLATVAVAVDGQQHLGLDLGEAVDHAARAELRRGARPDGPDRGGGEEGDERLGDVGHVGDHAIAPAHAERAKARGRGGHLRRELAPAQLAEIPQLGGVQDRHRRLIASGAGEKPREHVLGVVELCALEPARAGHRRGRRAPALTVATRARRRTPRCSPRSPRAHRPTSARARRSRRTAARGALRPSA